MKKKKEVRDLVSRTDRQTDGAGYIGPGDRQGGSKNLGAVKVG